MNNEPVAWMEYIQGEEWEVWFVEPTDLPKGHTYKPLYTHPVKEVAGFFGASEPVYPTVKELTDEDRSMLIRTLKWSEDLLRVAGHDEAVSDVQDCLMILRKAQR